MTEDQDHNDPTAGPPASGPEPDAAQGPAAETTGPAIPLPATTPPPVSDAPSQWPGSEPVTPPQGLTPETGSNPESTPPQGTYALGALAGNPMLGQAPQTPLGPHDTDPGAPFWPAPPAPPVQGTSASGNTHALRNGLLAGLAAVAVLAAGVGIGHAAWTNGTNTQALCALVRLDPAAVGFGFGSAGRARAVSSATALPSEGDSATRELGNSGNSGSGNSGSSNSSGPSDVDAIASKVDPGLVDVNTSLGYQQVQAAGTGIVLTSNGVILTNNHVIDGATSISVTDVGNQKTYTASVVGYDRTQDIAVLQLHNASGLQTATLGNSSNASVGEDIVGIGNAGGTGGTPSAAGGTVTAPEPVHHRQRRGRRHLGAAQWPDRNQREHPARRFGRRARRHLGTGARGRHRCFGGVLVPVQRPITGEPGLRHPDQHCAEHRPRH